jgi:hypothetical protein
VISGGAACRVGGGGSLLARSLRKNRESVLRESARTSYGHSGSETIHRRINLAMRLVLLVAGGKDSSGT